MNDLVYLKNEEAMTDSLMVAESFGKRHDRVIRAIESIINDSPQKWGQCFKVSSYKDESGKKNKMYRMNEKAFSVLVMGFTGKKALEWKWKYAEAFEKMRGFLSEKQTEAWIETRKAGMLTRKAETDTIKALVEYAKEQGSTHSDKLYMTYTRLANHFAGIEKRDNATVMQLNNLSLIENMILNIIQRGIYDGKHYKQIYKDCKAYIDNWQKITYLSAGAGV